jgi:hypothetical protein
VWRRIEARRHMFDQKAGEKGGVEAAADIFGIQQYR